MTDAGEIFEQDQQDALIEHIAEFGIRAYATLTVLAVLPEFHNYHPAIHTLMAVAPEAIAIHGMQLAITASQKSQEAQQGE